MASTETNTTSASASRFPDSVRMSVHKASQNHCWACGFPSLQVAHVIERGDTAIQILDSKGLIPFNLRSQANAVGLCTRCHETYDDHNNPGFVFLPVDLAYFIKFELRDRLRRDKVRCEGGPVTRIVPTKSQYRGYLKRTGQIPRDTEEATYMRFFLVPDFGGPEGNSTTPKEWGGEPIGTLRRGIQLLGCPRIGQIPPGVRDQLLILRDLYFLEDGDAVRDKHGLLPPDESEDLEGLDGDEEGGADSSSFVATSNTEAEQGHQDTPVADKGRIWEWVFGPSSTANDAIDEMAPSLMGPGNV